MELLNGTYSALDGELSLVDKITFGYWVSLANLETKVLKSALTPTLMEDIADAYRLIALREAAFVGIWSDNEHVYFDVSTWISDREAAINAGKKYGQRAIYDIAQNKNVDLASYPFVASYGKAHGISNLSMKHAEELARNHHLKHTLNGLVKD